MFYAIISILLILPCFSYANHDRYFEFVGSKEGIGGVQSGSLSEKFLSKLANSFSPEVFFETGTFDGRTSLNAAKYFSSVITVENFRPLFESAQPRLAAMSNIKSYFGESAATILACKNQLQKTVLFWLDAHYSGPGTGTTLSALPGSHQAFTPIREELHAIHEAGIQDCVILIDDIRGFGSKIHDALFGYWWAYPSVQELKESLLQINPNFNVVLIADALLAYDMTKYDITFSPCVQACTVTRFYSGNNLSAEDFRELGAKLRTASQDEIETIDQLYNMVQGYDSLMMQDREPRIFWYYAWQEAVARHNTAAHKQIRSCIHALMPNEEGRQLYSLLSNLWLDNSRVQRHFY